MLNRLDSVRKLNINTEIEILETKLSRMRYFVDNRYEGEELEKLLGELKRYNEVVRWVEQ